MLNSDAQNEVFRKYCDKPLKKSLHENFAFEDWHEMIDEMENIEDFANVAYIDICDFSNKVQDFTSAQVKNYLNEYYSRTMKYIKQCNGQIDKLMGDGIIVVFSKVFGQIDSNIECSNSACICCANIINDLKETEFEVKASLGSGKIFFCKTGVEQIYEEYTAVGYPYTMAYRLESIADNNQILFQNSGLRKRLEKIDLSVSPWVLYEIEENLKGLKFNKINVLDNL